MQSAIYRLLYPLRVAAVVILISSGCAPKPPMKPDISPNISVENAERKLSNDRQISNDWSLDKVEGKIIWRYRSGQIAKQVEYAASGERIKEWDCYYSGVVYQDSDVIDAERVTVETQISPRRVIVTYCGNNQIWRNAAGNPNVPEVENRKILLRIISDWPKDIATP